MQFMQFNTLYQLLAMKLAGSPLLEMASGRSKESTLLQNLRTFRSQIELYKVQHGDQPPMCAPDGSVVLLGSGLFHDAESLQRLTIALPTSIDPDKVTWQAVGLEMEGGHYQRAISAAIIRGHIPREVRVRYAYYASDNPLISGQTLAAKYKKKNSVHVIVKIKYLTAFCL